MRYLVVEGLAEENTKLPEMAQTDEVTASSFAGTSYFKLPHE